MDRDDKNYGWLTVAVLWLLEKTKLLKAAENLETKNREKHRADSYRLEQEKAERRENHGRKIDTEIARLEQTDVPPEKVPTTHDLEKGLEPGHQISAAREARLARLRATQKEIDDRSRERSADRPGSGREHGRDRGGYSR